MKSGWSRFGHGAVRVVLGPWPFFPWVIFATVFLLILLQNIQVSLLGNLSRCRFSCVRLPEQFTPSIIGEFGAEAVSSVDVVALIGNSAAAAGASAIVLAVANRYLRKDEFGSPSRGPYLWAMLFAALAFVLARVYVFSPVFLSTPNLLAIGVVPATFRAFIALTFVQAIAGTLTLRFAQQTAVATAALKTVKAQQVLVIEADERARRGVAEFLHDRVQADLLVVAFELRSCIEGASPLTRERLEKAISEIERIRSTEVRSASRRLSPAFGSIGLDTALQELADSWDPVMRVSVNFDGASRALLMGGAAPRDLLTGIYRVVEQALLNSAAHGQARRVDVSLSMPASDSLELLVTDDGRGLARGEVVRGSGTAIMDAWCAAAGGEWRWNPAAGGGLVVTAVFNASV